MSNILNFPVRNSAPGLRETLRDTLADVHRSPVDGLEFHDHLLALLWARGFKIVPLGDVG